MSDIAKDVKASLGLVVESSKADTIASVLLQFYLDKDADEIFMGERLYSQEDAEIIRQGIFQMACQVRALSLRKQQAVRKRMIASIADTQVFSVTFEDPEGRSFEEWTAGVIASKLVEYGLTGTYHHYPKESL